MSGDRIRDALLWLEYATDDLAAARAGGRALRPRHVASLAQQSAEKALKALVVLAGGSPPKTHDLEHLRSMLPDRSRARHRPADLDRLSTYGVRARYPDNVDPVMPIHSALAVRQAIAVLRVAGEEFERAGIDSRVVAAAKREVSRG